MEEAFPDALVERCAYERLIAGMPNEEKDRHVLAAAVASRSDVLVTANLDDFPLGPCREWGIDVQGPDIFLQHQV